MAPMIGAVGRTTEVINKLTLSNLRVASKGAHSRLRYSEAKPTALVAQRLELMVHNRLVGSSSLSERTIKERRIVIDEIIIFIFSSSFYINERSCC